MAAGPKAQPLQPHGEPVDDREVIGLDQRADALLGVEDDALGAALEADPAGDAALPKGGRCVSCHADQCRPG